MIAHGNRMSEHLASQEEAARELAAKGQQWLRQVQDFVAERPVSCLAGAFATGLVIAWFLKRTR